MSDKSNQSDGHLRIGDAEREISIGHLSLAHSLGQLDASEFDERTMSAAQAKTRDDLAGLTFDLPPIPEAKPDSRRGALAQRTADEHALRRAWSSSMVRVIAVVLAINLVTWTIAGVSGDHQELERTGAHEHPGEYGGYDGDHAFMLLPLLLALLVAIRLGIHLARRRRS